MPTHLGELLDLMGAYKRTCIHEILSLVPILQCQGFFLYIKNSKKKKMAGSGDWARGYEILTQSDT